MPATALDERTALVTIDLQNWVSALPTVHPMDEVLDGAARLSAGFRQAGLPVIHVGVGFAADFGDAFVPRADAPLPQLPFAEGWDEPAAALGVQPGDVHVVKHQWDAFFGTDLDVQLRRRGATGIVLAGVATSLGVESTARSAMSHALNVTIAADAVTDVDPNAHAASMTGVFPRLGEIDSADAILALVGARA